MSLSIFNPNEELAADIWQKRKAVLCLEEASAVTAWPQQEQVNWMNEERSLISSQGQSVRRFGGFNFGA